MYSKQIELINLQLFASVILSQDANPSLITHSSITRDYFGKFSDDVFRKYHITL